MNSWTCHCGSSCLPTTTQGEPCVFPFLYRGKRYKSCTDKYNSDKMWCATKSTNNDAYIKGKWGNCDCPRCAGIRQPCHSKHCCEKLYCKEMNGIKQCRGHSLF